MSWCEKQSEKLYVTKHITDVERFVDEFVDNNCYKNQYLLRIFTLKTPESITNHVEVDEDPGVVEIPVPIRDMHRLVELDDHRFLELYELLVGFMKHKIKQEYFRHHRTTSLKALTTVNELSEIIINVRDNDYFTFGDESRVNVLQRIAQRNNTLINIDTMRDTISVESYLIELISYLLFDRYQPTEDPNALLMRANLQTREMIGLPTENKISELVIEPVYQIAEYFRFSNVPIPIDHFRLKEDKEDLAYFLKRFYGVDIKNVEKITEIELFVFYFVMGLLRLIEADKETVYDNYILTAQDHLFWLHDEKHKNFIDIFYNHVLDF